jgi:hypothetical protein
MNPKIENPIYEIARRYAMELDISAIVMVEQAVRLYKSLHSKTDWLERFHKECELINESIFQHLTNEEFFDSVITAQIWDLLETKLGVAKSSYQLAVDEIQIMEKEISSGNYDKIFGVYPRKAWEKLKERVRLLQYPWLAYEENILLLLMVAFHKYHFSHKAE